jgi:hypothetical protein
MLVAPQSVLCLTNERSSKHIDPAVIQMVMLDAVCCPAEVTPNSAALTAQENAVAQTMATSCFKVCRQCSSDSAVVAVLIVCGFRGVGRQQHWRSLHW